jgi:hypothetical protein
MASWNGFRGKAKRIDDIDLPRIGSTIGVGEDELHAFMDVESAGSGFDSQDRPKALYEPHVAYRNSKGAVRNKLVAAGLAYPKWGTKRYPKSSYSRIEKCMAISPTVALLSTSWGLTQILGENYRICGFSSPAAMVRAFMDDEAEHLEATVKFLVANGIDDDLRDHNWAVVARVYNGPGYKKHNYDGRMAAAYAKWQRIRDTPWDGAVPPAPVPPLIQYRDELIAEFEAGMADPPAPPRSFWGRFWRILIYGPKGAK